MVAAVYVFDEAIVVLEAQKKIHLRNVFIFVLQDLDTLDKVVLVQLGLVCLPRKNSIQITFAVKNADPAVGAANQYYSVLFDFKEIAAVFAIDSWIMIHQSVPYLVVLVNKAIQLNNLCTRFWLFSISKLIGLHPRNFLYHI